MRNPSVADEYTDRTPPIDRLRLDRQLLAREALWANGQRGDEASEGNRFGLTGSELAVVLGVLRADTNGRIASRLSMTPQVVKRHLASVFTKLGVVTRLQLAVFAVRHRLIPDAVVLEELGLAMAERGTTPPFRTTGLPVRCFRGCRSRNPNVDQDEMTARRVSAVLS